MNRLRILCTSLLLACGVLTAAGAPVRVALVSQSTQSTAGQTLDLALVELTKQSDIELVEREAIEAVLREHQIALTEADAGLRVGPLLRADLIGVVDATPDGKELGGLVVLDSASGVVFANEGLAGLKAPEAAALVAKAVSVSAKKRALPADQRNTVCLLGARNSEFARSKDVFCETVAYLVERRLLQAAGVTTLDRRRLDAVLKENALPGQAERKALLPSLRLLELDFRRGTNDGEMRVVLRLSDAKGNTVATVEVKGPEEAPKLVELAGAKVCDLLRIAPPAQAGDPKAEAERFRKQADYQWRRELADESLQALDAAAALDPGSAEAKRTHIDRVFTRAWDDAYNERYELAVRRCARGLDLETQYGIRRRRAGVHGADGESRAIGLCADMVPVGTPLGIEVEDLRLRCLEGLGLAGEVPGIRFERVLMDRIGEVLLHYDLSYTPRLRFPVLVAMELCRSNEEFFRLLNRRLDGWLEREATVGAEHDWHVLYALYDLAGGDAHMIRHGGKSALLPFDAEYAKGFRAVCARMIAHPRTVVQLEGRLGEVFCDLEVARLAGIELPGRVLQQRLLHILRAGVAAAGHAQTPPGDTATCYNLATHALDLVRRTEAMERTFFDAAGKELVTGMLTNRHLSGIALRHVWENKVGVIAPEPGGASAPTLDPLWERVLTASMDPAWRKLEQWNSEVVEVLAPVRKLERTRKTLKAPCEILWTNHVARPPQAFLGAMIRDGEQTLYSFTAWRPRGYPNDGGPVVFQRTDLSDRRTERLFETTIRAWLHPYSEQWYLDRVRMMFVTDTCMDTQDRLIIATSGDGILIIPRGAEREIRIGTAEGLPGSVIQSLAVLDNILFAACGDAGYSMTTGLRETENTSHLVRYDLATRQCAVIASTGRATPLTPWDAMEKGFFVRKIVPDPDRKRLLLILNAREFSAPTGLWEYRFVDNGFRQLLHTDREIYRAAMNERGLLELLAFTDNESRPIPEPGGWWGLIHFDPRSDTARLVCVNKTKGGGAQLPLRPDTHILAGVDPAHLVLTGDWAYYLQYVTTPGQKGVEVRRRSLVSGRDELVDVSGTDADPFGRWGLLDWLPASRTLLLANGREVRVLKPNHDRTGHGLLDATREQFVGRWAYAAQGKQWEREFLADGTARLRVDGKDTPFFNGFKWTVEDGALLLRRGDGTLDERSYLVDSNTMTFTMSGWEPAHRLSAPEGMR